MGFDAVKIIKGGLPIKTVFEWYGYVPNSRGFVCCPFHTEKTPSMKLNLDDNSFHCFGCGEHGDVITFVQKLFNLSFADALNRIDSDFRLNIYDDKTFAEMKMIHYRQKSFEAKREREKFEKETQNNKYWEVFDEWKRLEDNKEKYAPKTPDEELHPLFVEALQKLPHQKYLLDCAEERRVRV